MVDAARKQTEIFNGWKMFEPATNYGLYYAEDLAGCGVDPKWAKEYLAEVPIAKIRLAQWDSVGALALLEVPIRFAPGLDS